MTTRDPAEFRDPAPFAHAACGQSLAFFPSGPERLAALLRIIDSAALSLDVCFYIYEEDATGALVRDRLVAAARRGVRVVLILDGFGARAREGFFADLVAVGGQVYYFSTRPGLRYLIRNHQKMVIADSLRAMFGGFNIADDYFVPPEADGWTDLAIALEGPSVAGLVDWFARLEDWSSDARAPFRAIRRAAAEWEWSNSDGSVRWLVGGPSTGLSSWARCVTRDLFEARRLDMLMAYFSPPYTLLRRIARVARLGGVRLVMAARSDNPVTIGATRSLYAYLLRRRARIWEFLPNKLHTKLILIDETAYLGSANFDMRSLYLNCELMLRIEDAALAERLRLFITEHTAFSRRITPAGHRRRASLLRRLRWNASWLLVSLVDYTVARGLRTPIRRRDLYS